MSPNLLKHNSILFYNCVQYQVRMYVFITKYVANSRLQGLKGQDAIYDFLCIHSCSN